MHTILFDLDGTLLSMDTDAFIKKYFKILKDYFGELGYDDELVFKGVMAGTKRMIENTGEQTNETVFWQTFSAITNFSKEEVSNDFNAFYRDVFPTLHTSAKANETMVASARLLKAKGYRLILTTNPVFPVEAVRTRLSWTGLSDSFFDDVTSYERSCATKPSILYYEEVLTHYQLQPRDCMMVGNDSLEDGVIEKLGVSLYLIEDDLIHRSDEPLTSTWHGSSDEFYRFVETMKDKKEKGTTV